MRFFLFKLLTLTILVLFPCSAAQAESAKSGRIVCGPYSFVVPEGFEHRFFQGDGGNAAKELVINNPYSEQDAEKAIITCVQERRSSFYDFILSELQSIKIQIGPRAVKPMFITATEDITRGNLRFKFSILEEQNAQSRVGKGREVRGRYHYIPVIEVSSMDDEYYTLIIINDLRQPGGFFDMAEYRAYVTNTAVQLMRSIRKHAL